MTTDQIAKTPADAKTALAQAIDQSTGLDLMTLSTVMVQSGFFPNAESVAQGVVKILAGRELGFPAIASMRHIYVHNGHIGLQATLIATQIRRSGTYDYRIVESSDTKCEIEFLRLKDEWRVEGKASFTIEEAKRAGLIKDKSAWQTYPSDLLFARAMTRGQRRFCPDVFGQTVYSEEEVREIAAAEPTLVGGQTLEERMAEMMPREKPASVGDSALQSNINGPIIADRPATSPAEDTSAHEQTPEGVQEGREPARSLTAPPQQRESETEMAGQHESLEKERPPVPTTEDLPGGQPTPTKKTVFTVGTQRFETNGITRAQMMELFKLYPRVAKKYGQEKAADVLKNEFKVEHRADLTEEQAERYAIRLQEMLE